MTLQDIRDKLRDLYESPVYYISSGAVVDLPVGAIKIEYVDGEFVASINRGNHYTNEETFGDFMDAVNYAEKEMVHFLTKSMSYINSRYEDE